LPSTFTTLRDAADFLPPRPLISLSSFFTKVAQRDCSRGLGRTLLNFQIPPPPMCRMLDADSASQLKDDNLKVRVDGHAHGGRVEADVERSSDLMRGSDFCSDRVLGPSAGDFSVARLQRRHHRRRAPRPSLLVHRARRPGRVLGRDECHLHLDLHHGRLHNRIRWIEN
jgi:hypothetical protein